MWDSIIDDVGKKYSYSIDLINSLKLIVPAMAKGRSDEEIFLLIKTLYEVEIFIFEKYPTYNEIYNIFYNKYFEKKDTYTSNSCFSYDFMNIHSRGIFNKKRFIEGEFKQYPIFDDNCSIVDKICAIYICNDKYNKGIWKKYTNINLNLLIHELGHAWAAMKNDFVLCDNNSFIQQCGTLKTLFSLDNNKFVLKSEEGRGLEESLDIYFTYSILRKVLKEKDFIKAQKNFASSYDFFMYPLIKVIVDAIGEDAFYKLRILKDDSCLEEYNQFFTASNIELLKRKICCDVNDRVQLFAPFKGVFYEKITKESISNHFFNSECFFEEFDLSSSLLNKLNLIFNVLFEYSNNRRHILDYFPEDSLIRFCCENIYFLVGKNIVDDYKKIIDCVLNSINDYNNNKKNSSKFIKVNYKQ